MPELVVSLVVSVAILALLFAWVPLLHLCHGCVQRLDRGRGTEREATASAAPADLEAA